MKVSRHPFEILVQFKINTLVRKSPSISPFGENMKSFESDNNAKIRLFAPIGIQLHELHPPQGYLHNCKHSIKFQDFH